MSYIRCYFLKDQFLRLYQFYQITEFKVNNLQEHFHRDNLLFVCLKFYKCSCPNILAGNICLPIPVKNQRINRNEYKKSTFYIISHHI